MTKLQLHLSILSLFAFTVSNAQLSVSTTPQNKNFLIEKGSGIACCSCPAITDKCMVVVNAYPKGKGFFMIYHFGPDARPQAGQLNKDYKTPFGDSILTPVWPFYLNMMVNRIDRGSPYGSTFIFGPNNDQVTPEAASVSAQTAPVNLALTSSYNAATREITVDAKAYYTSNSATTKNYLQIALTEDSMVGPQCVNSSPFIYNFVHMDMFRANMNGPVGDAITTTTAGTTVTKTYTYTVPAKYGSGTDASAWITPNPAHFNLVMFMTEDVNGTNTKFGKIQNVIGAPLGGTAMTGVEEIPFASGVSIYPNPSTGVVTVNTNSSANLAVEVMDLVGRVVYSAKNMHTLDLSGLNKGIYHIKISSEKGSAVRKVLFTD